MCYRIDNSGGSSPFCYIASFSFLFFSSPLLFRRLIHCIAHSLVIVTSGNTYYTTRAGTSTLSIVFRNGCYIAANNNNNTNFLVHHDCRGYLFSNIVQFARLVFPSSTFGGFPVRLCRAFFVYRQPASN